MKCFQFFYGYISTLNVNIYILLSLSLNLNNYLLSKHLLLQSFKKLLWFYFLVHCYFTLSCILGNVSLLHHFPGYTYMWPAPGKGTVFFFFSSNHKYYANHIMKYTSKHFFLLHNYRWHATFVNFAYQNKAKNLNFQIYWQPEKFNALWLLLEILLLSWMVSEQNNSSLPV